MKFKYKVMIGDLIFEFSDESGSTAKTFAEMAVSHIKSDNEVIIKIETVE